VTPWPLYCQWCTKAIRVGVHSGATVLVCNACFEYLEDLERRAWGPNGRRPAHGKREER
jgi:hypothetical protein